eukprot:7448377-Ditylum_brightwellii.AAC.1
MDLKEEGEESRQVLEEEEGVRSSEALSPGNVAIQPPAEEGEKDESWEDDMPALFERPAPVDNEDEDEMEKEEEEMEDKEGRRRTTWERILASASADPGAPHLWMHSMGLTN